jgi:hypothetical protein
MAPGIPRHHPEGQALVPGIGGGMERAAARRALHHHHRRRQRHQQTVAAGEVTTANRRTGGLFAQQQAATTHRPLQGPVVLGVHPLQRGAQHPHRSAIPLQAAPMDRPIDPLRQSTHHRPAGPGQSSSNRMGHRLAMERGVPGPDHGNGPAPLQEGPERSLALPIKGQGRPLELTHGAGERPGHWMHPRALYLDL